MNTASFLGTVGLLSIMVLFYVLARLSEKFGAVIKMPPIYRYYYVSLALTAVSYVIHLAVIGFIVPPPGALAWLASPLVLLLTYHLPLAAGVSLALFITWRYWSWLVTEPNR